MPPRHPDIARALGQVRANLADVSLQGATIVVAWSGGPDSAALLGLMELLAPGLDARLVVGHVDHGIRPESVDEARLVQRVAAEHGLASAVERLRLSPGPALAERAREARRGALGRMAERFRADVVALGHTATDQAETLLMHLTRGAGLEGMAGMELREHGTPCWVRPLLTLTRAETRSLAQRLQLPFVDDPTNVDPKHFRVRLRAAVLPELRARNPRVERAMVQLARHARDAEDALMQWSDRELEARRCPPHVRDEAEYGPITHHWSVEGLAAMPRAIRTRVLRDIAMYGGVGPPRAEVIDAVDAALCAGDRRGKPRVQSWDLHGEFRLRLSRDGVWLAPAGPKRSNH